jgi:hypothetical protein
MPSSVTPRNSIRREPRLDPHCVSLAQRLGRRRGTSHQRLKSLPHVLSALHREPGPRLAGVEPAGLAPRQTDRCDRVRLRRHVADHGEVQGLQTSHLDPALLAARAVWRVRELCHDAPKPISQAWRIRSTPASTEIVSLMSICPLGAEAMTWASMPMVSRGCASRHRRPRHQSSATEPDEFVQSRFPYKRHTTVCPLYERPISEQ